MHWTSEDDRKLLLTIIEKAKKRPVWKIVAESMGEKYSAQAVRQRYSRLKKELNNTDQSDENPVENAAPIASSSKRQPTPDSENSAKSDIGRKRQRTSPSPSIGQQSTELTRGHKRQRTTTSNDGSEVDEPLEPRKLFVGTEQVGSSKVASGDAEFEEISIPKKVELPTKASDDNDE